MKSKKIVGIIQLVGGIILSLITFVVWEIVKKSTLTVQERSTEIVSLIPLMFEGFSGLLFFIFIITLIISVLFMLQGIVNIKED
jgi:hypothetical protein